MDSSRRRRKQRKKGKDKRTKRKKQRRRRGDSAALLQATVIAGYYYGYGYMRNHQEHILQVHKRDNMFMVKYIFMLDSIFQSFIHSLSKFLKHHYPIIKALKKLKKYMRNGIKKIMEGFDHNTTPNLELPSSLIDQDNDLEEGREQHYPHLRTRR